jgi:hypothetical protein
MHDPDSHTWAAVATVNGARMRSRCLVLGIAIVLSACGGTASSATRDASPSTASAASPALPTASASDAPSTTPRPSTPSTADTFAPLAMIRAVNPSISLRAGPGMSAERLGSLAEGSRSLVVQGPVVADDLSWYWLFGPGLPPASGCATPVPTEPFSCPAWSGWAATGPANDWFALDPTACPDASSDLREFAMLGDYEALHCADDQELELVGWLHDYTASPQPAACPTAGVAGAPDWLWCHDRFWESLYANPDEEVFIDLYVDPASGISLPHDGRWVSVTGHLDDAAATRCSESVAIGWPIGGDAADMDCRTHLVVTSVRDLPGPP